MTIDNIVILLPPEIETFSTLIFRMHLSGQHFINDNEVKSAVNDWLKKMDTEWYGIGIKKDYFHSIKNVVNVIVIMSINRNIFIY